MSGISSLKVGSFEFGILIVFVIGRLSAESTNKSLLSSSRKDGCAAVSRSGKFEHYFEKNSDTNATNYVSTVSQCRPDSSDCSDVPVVTKSGVVLVYFGDFSKVTFG